MVASIKFLNRFFPFFFALDEHNTLVNIGNSLAKVLNWNGAPLPISDVLQLRFPYEVDLSHEAFYDLIGAVIIFDIKDKKSQLKGEFITFRGDDRTLIFMGSLLLNPDENMDELQLSLADFPSNDNSSNLLFSLKAQRAALEEVTGLTRQLKEQQAEMRKVNQELMQYTHAVSHDLKTPLRNIMSFMQLLLRSLDPLSESQEEYVDFILQAVRRMEQLIKDLSTDASIRERPAIFQNVDTQRLIEDVERGLRSEITAVNGRVIFSELPVIKGDYSRLYQLFSNFIQNSLKYRSGQDPVIRVEARQEKATWVFSVADNGIGMDQAFLPKIFKPFIRLHNHADIEGSGLGLSICHRIVEQHGGSIRVDSEPGKGTVFYIQLPR
ncbi:MAG: ATP-binding protein [Phaeodactylibacter sp.]|uniref:sensor histidine kinase n=1 Tax=Phaeodactylibacter sp. TaxID=1940289 RepID=UPI0032EF1DE2